MIEFKYKYRNDKNKLIITAENEESANKVLDEILDGWKLTKEKKELWELVVQ